MLDTLFKRHYKADGLEIESLSAPLALKIRSKPEEVNELQVTRIAPSK